MGKDDDKIRSFLCPGKIGLDRVKRHKAVNHPRLSRRAAVETVGVIKKRDVNAVLFDHTEPVRALFRVVNAKRCDVGIVLPPVAAGIENACLALIKAVVRCTGHDGKARLGQCVRHLRGRAEIGVVRVERRVAYQNRLLIDAGNVILRNDRRDGLVERRKIIAARWELCRPVDGIVNQIIAQRHQRHTRSFRLGLGFRLCGKRLRFRLRFWRLRLLHGGFLWSIRFSGDLRSCRVRCANGSGRAQHPKRTQRDRRQKQHNQNRANKPRRAGFLFLSGELTCHRKRPSLVQSKNFAQI